MGLQLRSGDYVRYVFAGGRTIKDGEAAVIWNRQGAHRQIIGPKRVFLVCSTVRFLTRHKAESHQYLRVRHRDGRVKKIKGPCSMYENPVKHDGITVHDGIHLEDPNDCIIVYGKTMNRDSELLTNCNVTEDTDTSEAKSEIEPFLISQFEEKNERHDDKTSVAAELVYSKRVVHGPTVFIPKDDELVHQFIWSVPNKSGGLLEKKSMFHVLQTDSSRLLKIQLNIVTTDLVRFQTLMSFSFRVGSLFKCVAAKDPIEKMHTSVMADAQVIGNGMLGADLKAGRQRNIASMLSHKSTFPFLCETAKICGLRIDSVRVIKFTFPPLERRMAMIQQEHDAIRLIYNQEEAAYLNFLNALKTQVGIDMTKFMCSSAGAQISANILSRSSVLTKSLSTPPNDPPAAGGGPPPPPPPYAASARAPNRALNFPNQSISTGPTLQYTSPDSEYPENKKRPERNRFFFSRKRRASF